ncbi:hypothetical protein [Streptomyces rhizosphaericus]|uniref:Uncharacterized protein n=1 Tax=Streptomyces rhizosphaericus TaxID=114699 RepID=A0A6G4AHR5_9ACTN|nr:hypothetical protein [Streptomyces rhizosphaericus]NEW72986.1 hypothetical protein [Streptomyces rhizosphaericus]
MRPSEVVESERDDPRGDVAEEVGDVDGMGVAVQIAMAGQPVREFGVRGLIAEARVLSLTSIVRESLSVR